MKVKLYTKEQLSYFPVYPDTLDFQHKQEKVVREEGFKSHQIFLVNSGSGEIHIDGKTFVLDENDMFYISANIPHEYFGCDNNFKTTYLSFVGKGIKNIINYYNLPDYAIYKNKNNGIFNMKIKKLFDSIDSITELSELCSMTFSTVISFFNEVNKKELTPLEAVCNYIEENYSRPVTMDELLTVYPYSKTKLCRDFKKAYNATVFDVLLLTRLRHARYIIKSNPHIKLKDIAKSCGFNDVSYFCKMYKKYFGATPKSDIQ